MNRKIGLKAQALLALLISFAAAVLLFFIMNIISTVLLNSYFEKHTYISRKCETCLDSFQEYVLENNISAVDSNRIKDWQNSNKRVSLILGITRDGKTVYDSLASNMDINLVERDDDTSDIMETSQFNAAAAYEKSSLFTKRNIQFSDGEATVFLYGYFDQWVYDVFLMGETLLSVAVLCILFICLIRRKIDYILQLEKEIKSIETGDLDRPISVKGQDELASLANSLNQMRIALSESMQAEAETVKANYDLVVSISHDLRTPLTSLALYLDLIHFGKYKNAEELNMYIEKSRSKVLQISKMSNQLFDRFYLGKKNSTVLEEAREVRDVFDDTLSNTASYLAANGFEIQTHFIWPCEKASVSFDYINRIFDNISSNIIKYADSKFPVCIDIKNHSGYLQIQFSNQVRPTEKRPDSTGVGVENIKFMMDKMDGMCQIREDHARYSISLYFKLEQYECE